MSRVYARPQNIVKLDKIDIDELAWENKKLPKNICAMDAVYYHLVRSIYGCVKSGTMELQEAKNLKLSLANYIEEVRRLALDGAHILAELCKLTAPRSELGSKSREELLEIIVKMDAICCNIINRAEEQVPEFFEVLR